MRWRGKSGPRGAWCGGCRSDAAEDSEFFRGFCGPCWREWQAESRAFTLERMAIGELFFSQATIAEHFRDGPTP